MGPNEDVVIAVAVHVAHAGHRYAKPVAVVFARSGPGVSGAEAGRRSRVGIDLATVGGTGRAGVTIGRHEHVGVAVTVDVPRARHCVSETVTRVLPGDLPVPGDHFLDLVLSRRPPIGGSRFGQRAARLTSGAGRIRLGQWGGRARHHGHGQNEGGQQHNVRDTMGSAADRHVSSLDCLGPHWPHSSPTGSLNRRGPLGAGLDVQRAVAALLLRSLAAAGAAGRTETILLSRWQLPSWAELAGARKSIAWTTRIVKEDASTHGTPGSWPAGDAPICGRVLIADHGRDNNCIPMTFML